jgi:hypothetical protein
LVVGGPVAVLVPIVLPSALVSAGSDEVLPTDFGKYRLVKRIATGGMA